MAKKMTKAQIRAMHAKKGQITRGIAQDKRNIEKNIFPTTKDNIANGDVLDTTWNDTMMISGKKFKQNFVSNKKSVAMKSAGLYRREMDINVRVLPYAKINGVKTQGYYSVWTHKKE